MTGKLYFVVGVMAVAFASLAEDGFAPEDASREVRFACPPASARILPIRHGMPNGLSQIDAELAALKDDGFGGFVGNVSFTSNYLRDAKSWRAYRHAVEKAHEMGLRTWLYDEKGYPSCTAGGQTLEDHPEWQARAFLVSVTNAPDGTVKVTDIRDEPILEGTHVSISVSRFKYAYPNLLMPEPTARFVELTHEAYRRELGEALKYVDSTFTDEPSLMTLWMRPMPYLALPVSDELLASYAAKFGHPLRDDVPALVTGEPVGEIAAIRHRYWTMVAERVARNYTGRLTEWADRNGILSGGHLLAEECLQDHVPLYGDFFRVLRGLSSPGCDMLTSIPEQVPPVTPLLAGSAGELNGARRVMSEASDHSQRYRKQGDTRPKVQVTAREIVGSLNRQIWGGVNTFTSYYAWNAFSREERRAINEEIGRTLTLASEGRSAAEVALLYPSDALMTGFEPRKRGAGGELAERVAVSFRRAVRILFTAGRPFLVVDAASLATAKAKDGALVLGPHRWRTVVLPQAETLPFGAARKLADLVASGGQVLALGTRPVNSERAFPDGELAKLAATWNLVPDRGAGCLAEVVALRHEPEISVSRGARDVLRILHRRTAKDGDVFFVANDSAEPWAGALRLRGDPEVRVWNPRIGLSHTVRGEVPLELPPYAAVVLTTTVAVEGRLIPGTAAEFALTAAPFVAEPVAEPTLGKGTFVEGSVRRLADGFTRAETRLKKGDVDTFAFVNFAYAKSPFPAGAKGLALRVRVPKANPGKARLGVFLETKDNANYYAPTAVTLAAAGEHEVTCMFSEFSRHGTRGKGHFRLEDIRRVRIGYGGYFGQAGETVDFEVAAPAATVFRGR